MKVLLSLLGTVAITSSSAAFASSNVVVGHQREQARLIQNNSDIDGKVLEEGANNYFDNFKQQQLFSNNPAQTAEIEQVINYAKKTSLNYIQKFAEQNFSLTDIINQFSNEIPEFKTHYENSMNEIAKNQVNFSDFSSNTLLAKDNSLPSASNYSFSFDEIIRATNKVINNARTGKSTASTIAALSAVAAAVFGGTSGGFGITVPGAIACTTISTVSSVISFVIGKTINAFENKQTPITGKDAYNLGDGLLGDLDNNLIGKSTILSGVRGAFLGVSAVFSIFDAIEDGKDWGRNQ